jgi:hypothetical protein
MGGAAAELDEDYKADISSLLEVNRLDYRLPPSLSIATSRAEKHYPALNQQTQMGQPIIFTLSSGASYVDLLNSYISFYVGFSAGINVVQQGVRMPSHIGWANMFQKYIIIHSSGVELDRQNDAVGEFIQIQNYYNRSREKRRIQGSLYGLNECPYPSAVYRDTTVAYQELAGQTFFNAIGPGNAAAPSNPAQFPDGIAHNGQGDYDKRWFGKYSLGGGGVPVPDYPAGGFWEERDVNVVTAGGFLPQPGGGAANPAATQYIQVTIPLSHIAGFFDVDLLAPSFLCAGLRIELYTYPAPYFFQLYPSFGNQNPVWDPSQVVTIYNPTINVESFTLTDSIVRKLSQISSQSGLEWYWDAVHQTSTVTAQQSTSIQVSRALSRANNAIIKTRSVNVIQAPTADHFASDPWDLLGSSTANAAVDGTMQAYQVQLGAQYIPALPITTTPQYLHSALKTFNQFRRSDEVGGPTLAEFRAILAIASAANGAADTYFGGLAISAVPLESSSTLQQSGAAISAQRTAVVNITWNYARTAVTQRRVDLFVMYSKLATLFLDSVVVRS